MTSPIDNRVVNMTYDGKGFDDGVKRSDKAFGAFKKNVESNGNGISEALASIDAKLSAKGVAIAATVTKMTNAVTAQLTKMTQEWVKGPMKDGFGEYETKIGSLFNIFNAVKTKGSSFDNVTASIDKLNKYADKTIYNFGQMTENFQKFTTSGKSLDQASGLVMGLSNLAASVGAMPDRLAGATYQMSQLSTTMNLMDYNSLLNAGMASEVFRNTMMQVSSESGRMMTMFNGKGASNTAAEYFKKATASGISFRDMVSDKVFSDMDFAETMRRFSIETFATQSNIDALRTEFKTLSKTDPISADMMSKLDAVKASSGGFAAEMVRISNAGKKTISTLRGVAHESMSVDQYLTEATKQGLSFDEMAKDSKFTVGDLQTALDRLSVSSGMFAAATQVRTFTQMIGTVKEAIGSGWGETSEQVFGDLEEATALWSGLASAISGIIGPLQDGLNRSLAFWNENGGREAVIRGLVNAFNALADIVRPIGKAFKAVFAPLTGGDLVDASKKFQSFTERLRPSKKVVEGIATAFYVFFQVIKLGFKVSSGIVKIVLAILSPLKALGPIISKITGIFAELFSRFGKGGKEGQPTVSMLERFVGLLHRLTQALVAVVEKGLNFFTGGLSKLTGWLKPVTRDTGLTIDQLKSIADTAKTSGISVRQAVASFASNDKTLVAAGGASAAMIDKISAAVVGLDESTEEGAPTFGNWLSKITSLLPKSFEEIITMFNTIISFKLVSLAATVGNSIAGAMDAFTAPIRAINPARIILTLGALAASLLVISLSLAGLASLPVSSITSGLAALGAGLYMVDKFVASFSRTMKKMNPAEMIAMQGVLKAVSLSLLALSVSLRILSGAKPGGVAVAVVGMLALVKGMVLQLEGISRVKNPAQSAAVVDVLARSILKMSIGLRVLANANVVKLGVAVMSLIFVLKKFVGISAQLGTINPTSIKTLLMLSSAISVIALALRVLAGADVANALAASILMSSVLRSLTSAVQAVSTLGASTSMIKNFSLLTSAMTVLIGALSLLALSDVGSIVSAGQAIGSVMKSLTKAFKKIPENSMDKIAGFNMLMKAVATLAGALSLLAKAKMRSIIASALAIGIVMFSLNKTFSKMPSVSTADATSLQLLMKGISILATGMAVLATQKMSSILAAAIGLPLVVLAVGSAFKYVNGVNLKPAEILAFTGGLSLLSVGLAILSINPYGRQLSAGIGLALVVAALALVFKHVSNTNINRGDILVFVGGVTLLALGLTVLSTNPFMTQIAAGIGLGLVVLAVGKALKLASGTKVNPVSILAFTAGLSLLAVSMSVLSATGVNALAAAGAMAIAVIAMAGAMRIIAPVSAKAPMIGAGLLLMGLGMLGLAAGMTLMAAVPIPAIVASLLTMVAVLAALALVAGLLTPIVPVMVSVGGAVALVGAGIMGMGAGALMGVMALSAFLTLLAGSPKVFQDAAANVGQVAASLIEIANGLGAAIGVAMTMIIRIIIQAVITLLVELGKHAGDLASAGMQLMIAFLNGFKEHVDELVAVGVELIAQVLLGLAKAMPALLESAVVLILSFLDGLVTALDKHWQDIQNVGIKMLLVLIKGVVSGVQRAVETAGKIGSAIKDALVAGLTGKGWSTALDGFVGDIDAMIAAVSFTVPTSLDAGPKDFVEFQRMEREGDKYKKTVEDNTETTNKFTEAIKGVTDAGGDFRESISGLRTGGGIGALLGFDAGEKVDAVNADSLMPDGTFSGEATGEAEAAKVATGYEEGSEDGAKKAKDATEDFVKDGITGPLTDEGKKVNALAYSISNGLVENVVKGLTATVPKAAAANVTKGLTPIVKSVADRYQKELAKGAEKAEELAAAEALDAADQGVLKAYEAIQSEAWNKAREKAIAEAKATGAAIPEAYMTQEEKWAEAAKKMTKEQYDALLASRKVSRAAQVQFEQEIEDRTAAAKLANADTMIGALEASVTELGLAATPIGGIMAGMTGAISDAALAVEKAEVPGTLKSISQGLTVLGKLVPELDQITGAFSEFASALSEIGKEGVDPITTMYGALSALGTSLLDIVIGKLRTIVDTMGQIAETAANGVVEMITTSTQIGVDIVLDISSWVFAGGDQKLPDAGAIMGNLVDSLGGAAVGAGTSIADSLIGGMMDVFGLGAFKGVVSAFTGMFGTLGKMATTSMGKLIPMLYTAIKNLSVKLMPAWMTTFTSSFQKIFKKFFNRLFGEPSGDEGAKWFREHGAQLGEVYIEGLSAISEGNDDVVSETGNWLDEIAKKLRDSGSLFGALAGELVAAFADAWDGFNEWFTNIGASITGLISAGASGNIAAIYDYIMDFLYNLTGGFLGKKVNINALGDNIAGWILEDNGQIAEGVRKFIGILLDVLTLGIYTRGDDAILLGRLMNDRILAGLADTPQEALSQIIAGILSALLKFMGAIIPDLIVLGGQVTRAVFDGMMDFIRQGGFFQIIGAIFEGLWNGFMKSETSIWDLGGMMAKALWEGFKASLGIKSPSKTFMIGGEQCLLGLAEGLKDTQPVDKAMTALAKGMEKGLSLIEGNAPVITPVVDLSEVRKRADALGGLFKGVELNSELATRVVSRQNGTKEAKYEVAGKEGTTVAYYQTINAPTKLSPRQIYRYTGNLLEIKKGKLA